MAFQVYLALTLVECVVFLAAYLVLRIYRPKHVGLMIGLAALAAAAYLATFIAMLIAGLRQG